VSSVLWILAEHPVKPWQYGAWIYPRDPDFEAKATLAFLARYNQTARPFNWKFTADDLLDLLARISARQEVV
jgi:hypothetical protein